MTRVIRTFVVLAICASLPILVDAVADGEWPDYSAEKWLVFVGGLVVIGVGFLVAESLVERRRASRLQQRAPEGT